MCEEPQGFAYDLAMLWIELLIASKKQLYVSDVISHYNTPQIHHILSQ